MRVAKYYSNSDIRVEEAEKPSAGPNEIVVKVISCGICGSDVAEWYRKRNAPLVAGHEAAGEIVEVGSDINGFKVGEKVFIAPKAACMECKYCKDGKFPVCENPSRYAPGGFSEYILVPERHIGKGVYKLPQKITCDDATFIEPLGCVIRAQKLGGVQKNRTVAVFGAGISGILHIRYAKSMGANVIATDVSNSRLEFAEKSGAYAVNAGDDVPSRIKSANNGKGADVAILSTGSVSAVKQAWESIDRGGSIVFFAVPEPGREVTMPINDFWQKEIKVVTSYYCGPDDMTEALNAISGKKIIVDDLITHHLPLKDTQKGFNLVLEGKNSLKVIVHPQL